MMGAAMLKRHQFVRSLGIVQTSGVIYYMGESGAALVSYQTIELIFYKGFPLFCQIYL